MRDKCGDQFLAAKRVQTCRPCAVKEFNQRAASHPADRIAANEALTKSIFADLPNALRTGGNVGLEGALERATAALRAFSNLDGKGLRT